MARHPFKDRPVAYTQVPSFRFATPPRSGRDGAPPGQPDAVVPGPKAWEGQPEWLAQAVLDADGETACADEAAPDAVQHGLPSALDGPPVVSSMSLDVVSSMSLDSMMEGEGAGEGGHAPPVAPVHPDVLAGLAHAYDESIDALQMPMPGMTGFKWTGVVDAAQAAWIGGTRMLRYGELLPGGVARALDVMLELEGGAAGGAGDGSAGGAGYGAAGSSGAAEALADGPCDVAKGQLVLELGMGRGKAALQLFLSGATVIGVELANERYGLAVAALERLAHRCPDQFEISKRTSQAVRIRRVDGPKAAICEVRLGNFFDVVTGEEVEAATLVFLQVCLPQPAWPRLRSLLLHTRDGCRILMYENLRRMWEGENFPFEGVAGPPLACSWAPERGHRFHCYHRAVANQAGGEAGQGAAGRDGRGR